MSGGVRRSVERVLELPTTPDAVPAACALLEEPVSPSVSTLDRSLVCADLRHQMAVAPAQGQCRVDVRLTVRRRDAEAARDLMHALMHALDEADRLSRTSRLLLTPAPRELSDARPTSLRRILAQLGS